MKKLLSNQLQGRLAILVVCAVVLCYSFQVFSMWAEPTFVMVNTTEELSWIKNGILYFGYPECPSCQTYQPVVEHAARSRGVPVYYINTKYFQQEQKMPDSEFHKILDNYRVESVPTIVAMSQGKPLQYMAIGSNDPTNYAPQATDITRFIEEAKDNTREYIPHYGMNILLLIATLLLFLYGFLADFLAKNGGTKLLGSFIATVGLMVLQWKTFSSSVGYLDSMGFSGNSFYGSMAMLSGVLCFVVFVKTCVVFVERNREMSL